MLIKQGATRQFLIPFDNTTSPGSLSVAMYVNGSFQAFAGSTGSVLGMAGPVAFLPYSCAAADTATVGDLMFSVTDGTTIYGSRALQVVPWDPDNANGLGLSFLDTTVSSRGTAVPGDQMQLQLPVYAAIASAIFTATDNLDVGMTFRDMCKVLAAVLAGEVVFSGGNAVFKSWDGSKDRVTMPIAGGGNRGPATFDLT